MYTCHPLCTNQIESNHKQVMEKSTARKSLWLRSSGRSLESRNRVSASDPDKELIGHVTHITRVTLISLCSPTLLRTCQLTPLTTLLELSRALSLSLSLFFSLKKININLYIYIYMYIYGYRYGNGTFGELQRPPLGF